MTNGTKVQAGTKKETQAAGPISKRYPVSLVHTAAALWGQPAVTALEKSELECSKNLNGTPSRR
ncbi:MAG TPA: hypothetical protein VJM81_07155 [Rhizorhapis sp.]|nr:hypothetical protein [Rhizorhapis sp.]